MHDEYTLFSTSDFSALVRKVIKHDKAPKPKESTLQLLRDFARNYRVNANMPEGMQGYMLS